MAQWGQPRAVASVPEQQDLANYITALGYGTDDENYQHWWIDADNRTHIIGKGITRFHAVYWPAMLMSAGAPLPDTIFVHDYLTVEGRKLGKSLGNAIDPVAIVEQFGTDALRWWLVRDVPRVGDADFTLARLVTRANEDLANNIGNLVNRTVSMIHKYRDGRIPALAEDNPMAADVRAARSGGHHGHRPGPGSLRLPPCSRSSCEHRRRGQPLRPSHQALGPGQVGEGRRDQARCTRQRSR